MTTAVAAVSVVVNVVLLIAFFYVKTAKDYMDGIMEDDKPLPVRPTFRRFVLYRYRDVTGVSGSGVVAEGMVFSTGYAVLHWLDLDPVHEPTTVTYHNPGVEGIEKIHGHGGATKVRWLDPA